jgi:hypothetical protein
VRDVSTENFFSKRGNFNPHRFNTKKRSLTKAKEAIAPVDSSNMQEGESLLSNQIQIADLSEINKKSGVSTLRKLGSLYGQTQDFE